MSKMNFIALIVLIIMAGLVSCTDENLAPTKSQNGANSQITTTKDNGNNNAVADKKLKNPKNPSLQDIAIHIVIFDHTNPWYACLFGSGTCNVTITITIPFPFDFGMIQVPPGATPVVLQATDGSFDGIVDGYSGELAEPHLFTPGGPNVIYGVSEPILFPVQTMVYSSEYQGFVGYYFVQAQP